MSDLHVPFNAFVLSWLIGVDGLRTPVLAATNPMMEELIEPGNSTWNGTPESLRNS